MDIKKYLMENPEEALRLEIKTDTNAVRRQAEWCGLKPGMRVMDAGCGPGMITSILNEMIQPDGEIIGVDYSQERVDHATKHYEINSQVQFKRRDLTRPITDLGQFDLIWIRFFLEYFKKESFGIVKNLTACLKPGGTMCLLDLDHNCLNHYGLNEKMEGLIFKLINRLEKEFNFDPYSGRKLYSFLYDLGYKDIKTDLSAHHLFYGDMKEADFFNWVKKVEVAAEKASDLFNEYPDGSKGFLEDFKKFFSDPRRFTYTPLIICKGSKSSSSI